MLSDTFGDLLRTFRNQRGLSAREMSLALGQNVNYINLIENGKRLPSMQGFFSICEYLDLQPSEFFEKSNASASCKSENIDFLYSLTTGQLKSIIAMIKEFL